MKIIIIRTNPASNFSKYKLQINLFFNTFSMLPSELLSHRRQFLRVMNTLLMVLTITFLLFMATTYTLFSYYRKIIIQEHEYVKDELADINLTMDNPRVLKKLKSDFLLPPQNLEPYNLARPQILDPSKGQSKVIRELLENKTNGFFIECGALDGETRSNTLYLERFLNWTGLLIEADPLNFTEMLKKHRRAWLSSSCLSKTPHPQKVSFRQSFSVGRISALKTGEHRRGYVDVQCFPLFSYLLAMNISHVDYFSLDVEGDELDILRTIPFDEVDIKTLSVEFSHVQEGKDKLKEFMESKGYSMVAEVTHPAGFANDFIFLKNNSE